MQAISLGDPWMEMEVEAQCSAFTLLAALCPQKYNLAHSENRIKTTQACAKSMNFQAPQTTGLPEIQGDSLTDQDKICKAMLDAQGLDKVFS